MRLILICIPLLFLSACKKPEPSKPSPVEDWEEICDSIPPSQSIFGYEWKTDGTTEYKSPFVYPTSPEKILLLKYVGGAKMIEYNLNTGEEKIITQNQVFILPRVSSKGDIVYYSSDLQLYMISNGVLRKATNSGANTNPIWNFNGTTYSYSSQIGSGLTNYIFKNLNDSTIDSIPYNTFQGIGSSTDINEHNIMCCEIDRKEDYGIGLINLTTKTLEKLYTKGFTDDGRAELNCVKWQPGNQYVYYSDGYGLFRVNVATKQKETVAKGCATRRYESFSFTPDGKTIYAERVHFKKVDENTILQKSRIYKMDADGNNMERVF